MSDEHNDAIKKNLLDAIQLWIQPTPSNQAQSSTDNDFDLNNLERLREAINSYAL